MTRLRPINILLDNSIFSISVVTEPAKKLQKLTYANTIQRSYISCIKVKSYPHNNDWFKEQVLCLPTVTRLSLEKKLELFTYSEIEYEGWKRCGIPSLIGAARISKLRPPIERSKFQQYTNIHKFINGEELIKFIKSLLECDENNLLKIQQIYEMLSPDERNNIRELPRLRTLCENLDDEKIRDAFHLWTGELYGIDRFLTVDKKFINAMTKSCNVKLKCLPITPSDLLNELNIRPDPVNFKPGQVYNVLGHVIGEEE